MQYMTVTRFSALARELTLACRSTGLRAPAFRSPPRNGSERSVRRYGDGSTMVSVVIHGRADHAVTFDMIEGVVAANGLGGGVANAARRTLWHAVHRGAQEAA